MSSSELLRRRPGSGKPGGVQLQAPWKVGWKGSVPVSACFGGEQCSFPVAEWEQDRVFCSSVRGLGRDISLHSPWSCCCLSRSSQLQWKIHSQWLKWWPGPLPPYYLFIFFFPHAFSVGCRAKLSLTWSPLWWAEFCSAWRPAWQKECTADLLYPHSSLVNSICIRLRRVRNPVSPPMVGGLYKRHPKVPFSLLSATCPGSGGMPRLRWASWAPLPL